MRKLCASPTLRAPALRFTIRTSCRYQLRAVAITEYEP
jgi:hypothetical protein